MFGKLVAKSLTLTYKSSLHLEKQFRSFLADIIKHAFETNEIDYLYLLVPLMSKTFISVNGKNTVIDFIKKVRDKVAEDREMTIRED